jgi:hypothetical protein
MLKGLDSSAVLYATALSPALTSSGGSSNPINLSKFTNGTLILTAGSTAAATIAAYVLRSGTSDGTFQDFGASVSAAVLGKTHVRTFPINTSAVWHRVFYTHTGAGSPAVNILLAANGTRSVPINQDSNTTSYGTVAG